MLRWLLKTSSYTVFLRVLAMVTTLGFVSIMSLWMPKADFGVLAMIISVASFASAIGGFGQSEMVVRDISPLLGEGRADEARAYLQNASGLVFYASLAMGLPVGLYFALSGYSVLVAISALAIVVFLGLNLVWSGAARSYDRYFLSLAPKDILWRLGTVLGAAVLLIFGLTPGIGWVAPICAGTLGLLAGWQAVSLGVRFGDLLRLSPRVTDAAYLRQGAPLMLAYTAMVVLTTVDVFIVGSLMSPEDAAEYFPANRLALIVTFFSIPLQMVIAPRIAQMMSAGDMASVQRITTFTTLILAGASIGAAIAIVGFYPLYQPLFGTATETTFRALLILAGSYAIGSVVGLPGVILVMAKRQNVLAAINMGCAVLSLVAIAVTALRGDLIEVALAVAGFELLRKSLIGVAVWKTAGIAPIHTNLIGKPN